MCKKNFKPFRNFFCIFSKFFIPLRWPRGLLRKRFLKKKLDFELVKNTKSRLSLPFKGISRLSQRIRDQLFGLYNVDILHSKNTNGNWVKNGYRKVKKRKTSNIFVKTQQNQILLVPKNFIFSDLRNKKT